MPSSPEWSVQWRKCRPWVRIRTNKKCAAEKKGIAFSLTNEALEQIWTGKCAITGLPFDLRTLRKPGPKPFSPSIDRIDPALGYVPGNVRWVLQCINAFRGVMSDRLMHRVAQRIV